MTTTLTITERVLATREAGHVRRCHVVPHHGEYSVATHCYHAVSMIFVLHPNPSIELINAMLWHDGAERWVGDMPGPAKWYDPALGVAYERAEEEALRTWGMYEGLAGLTMDEEQWLIVVDRLELLLWCHDQLSLGNVHIEGFINLIHKSMTNLIKEAKVPTEALNFYREFQWKRLPETV